MPRSLRIEYEGAWYHVMNRGANFQKIFLHNGHRELFLNILEEAVKQFLIEVHTYCLMDNHYHLLIRTPLANLGRALRHLNGVYTLRFNKMEKRDGPLFRGRYKAILIEEDSFLLSVSRYIHLNPIKARICNELIDYPWSSYQAFYNPLIKPHWLQTDFLLSYFKSRDLYKKFIEIESDEVLEKFYNQPQPPPILGTFDFIKHNLLKVNNDCRNACATDIKRANIKPTIEMIIRMTAALFAINEDEIKQSGIKGAINLPRMIAIYLARRLGMFKHKEIALFFFNISVDGVASAIKRCELQLQKNSYIKNMIDELKRRIEEELHRSHT